MPRAVACVGSENMVQPRETRSSRLTLRTALLTLVAMLAFAANSLLCRLALGPGLIDAASFTSIRVVSGAATLAVILALRRAS